MVLLAIESNSRLLGFLGSDPLQQFSWGWFGCIATAYTVLAIGSELLDGWKMRDSAGQCNAQLNAIFQLHSRFLVLLFLLFWILTIIYRLAPEWMIEPFAYHGRSQSILDVIFLVLLIVMGYVERRRAARMSRRGDGWPRSDQPK